MEDKPIQVFYPSNTAELFNAWDASPEGILYAGGTTFIHTQSWKTPDLPQSIILLDRIEELHRISRTERYLEIGAMVKLGQITDLGEIVPDVLRCCLENIAGIQLRNLATIGGNIGFSGGKLDLVPVLAALDALYEFRTKISARWISAARFAFTHDTTALAPHEIIARIRIPLEKWDYSAYYKFSGGKNISRTAIFIAKIQKNTLSDIRVIYKSGSILRDKDSESILIGKSLPLSRRIVADFLEHWESFLSSSGIAEELYRREMMNFIQENIYNL